MFQGFPEIKEALISNQMQAAFMVAPMAIALRAQGVPVKIVYLGHRYGSAVVVRKDGPAASAGLQVGDVIVSIDGHDVRAEPSLYWSLSKVSPGTTVALGLQRGAVARITAGPPR